MMGDQMGAKGRFGWFPAPSCLGRALSRLGIAPNRVGALPRKVGKVIEIRMLTTYT
jgi:hypothetical protein